jgi:hypothetical protein
MFIGISPDRHANAAVLKGIASHGHDGIVKPRRWVEISRPCG